MEERRIQLFTAYNGSTSLKVNNVLLQSAYYPEEVSKKFIESNKEIYENRKSIVIYGIALGYHIEYLLSKVSEDTNIYVFDIDREVFEICKAQGAYKKIIKDPRVKLYIGYSREFFYHFKLSLQEVEEFLLYTPSMKVLPKEYSDVISILTNFKMARDGINESKDIMRENYKSNLKENYFTMKEFFNTYTFKGEKIIIASAGPSLDENIDHLKKLQHKIKIFTVGSALRTLVSNGIKPYMICIIDPSEIVYNQIKGFEDLDIPLCFLITASWLAVSGYNGPKYMFYNDRNDNDDIIINTGKTVAISTMDIAVKGGASEIILVGQDLAFINNKSHTEYINESYKEANITNEVQGEKSLFKKVEGINGEILNTRSEYLNFKHFIELEIENNPHVKFINCSSGAKIKGTTWKPISKIL